MFLSHRAKAYFHNCVSISFLISIFSIQTPLLIENDLFLKLSCVTFSSDYFVLQDWPSRFGVVGETVGGWRGEYFPGVNIFQKWIFFRGEYFSGVNIFQGWIFFRGEHSLGVNIFRGKYFTAKFSTKIFPPNFFSFVHHYFWGRVMCELNIFLYR